MPLDILNPGQNPIADGRHKRRFHYQISPNGFWNTCRSVFACIKQRDSEAARQAMLEHLAFAEQRGTAFVTRQQQ